MSLNLNKPVRVFPCKIRTIAEQLDTKDREEFLNAINNKEWSALDLVKQLADNGIEMSPGPIWKHRLERCSC
jgi:hypothetical protein